MLLVKASAQVKIFGIVRFALALMVQHAILLQQQAC
jgi:hypothetical protein